MKSKTNSKFSVEGFFLLLVVISAAILVLAYIGGYMLNVIDEELTSKLLRFGFFGMVFSMIGALSNTHR